MAARISFLETRLLLSEEEVAREQKAAEAQLTAAKRKEEELKAMQNSNSPIHKSRATTGDFGQLQAELSALKEQKFALQTSIGQAELYRSWYCAKKMKSQPAEAMLPS